MPFLEPVKNCRRQSPRTAVSRSAMALGLVGALLLGSPATAQAGLVDGQYVINQASDITWQLVLEAPHAWSYHTVQQRTLDDGQGSMVTLRESLKVQGKGSLTSPFRLDFEAVVGQQPAAASNNRWRAAYDAHAGLIHRHGAFAVRDARQAKKNYRLISFGDASRAGRAAWRVVIFPLRLDKGIWVVDLDRQTGVPLYRAEYNSNGKLISELEVTSFSLMQASARVRNAWRPRLEVSRLTKLNQVASRLSRQPAHPEVGGIMNDYEQHMMHMTEDPLNGDKALVLGYTDGVDEFFIVQEFGRLDPLRIPRAFDDEEAHTIASYDDPHMRVYVFHHDSVTYKVVGRASLMRLQDVARHFCHQVVTTQ